MSLHCPYHVGKKKNGGNYNFHGFVKRTHRFIFQMFCLFKKH